MVALLAAVDEVVEEEEAYVLEVAEGVLLLGAHLALNNDFLVTVLEVNKERV